jgi:hypothetical protein
MKKPVLLTIILTFFLLVVVIVWYLFATGLGIDGIVLDSIEKKPISQATIKINQNSYFSDKDGNFSAHVPISPPSQLIIEKNGYKSFTKTIDYKGLQGSRKYEIYLEPLTFANLLTSARNDLLHYESFTFRYNWKNRIGESDQTTDYMIYEINQQKILHYKYLQDDRLGNTITEREIIKNKEDIFYKNNTNPAWIKINENQISVSKIQEPYDILQILQDETEPDSFIYDGTDTLYLDPNGKVLTKDELPLSSKDSQGKEIVYTNITVNLYTAKWNKKDGMREVKFFNDSKNFKLYKGTLYDESPEKLNLEELGKTLKQTLSFTISNINQPIEIKIPEI